jgi:hypothetical protein
MSLAEILNMLPGPPVISGAIGLVVAVILLYLARGPAHKAIYSIFRVPCGGSDTALPRPGSGTQSHLFHIPCAPRWLSSGSAINGACIRKGSKAQ